MMNVMTYKGYRARIEFDPRDNIFVRRVLGIEEGISLHGETVAALKEGFAAAINHYLADCKAMSRKLEEPASGKIMLCIAPEIHAKALVLARALGKSLNQWAAEVLAKAAPSVQSLSYALRVRIYFLSISD
jgi:predicted HicB family RNase H-like nuclease